MRVSFHLTGDPQCNGAAEVGVQLLKAHVRTQKDALEHNLGREVPGDHGLMTFIVRYVAASYRMFVVGPDGRTAIERNIGRKSKPAVPEFGEMVWWMPCRLPPLSFHHLVLGLSKVSIWDWQMEVLSP